MALSKEVVQAWLDKRGGLVESKNLYDALPEDYKKRYCSVPIIKVLCLMGRQLVDGNFVLSDGRVKDNSTECSSCGTQLGIAGGMENTGLCGPCCTGEAETLSEIGDTW